MKKLHILFALLPVTAGTVFAMTAPKSAMSHGTSNSMLTLRNTVLQKNDSSSAETPTIVDVIKDINKKIRVDALMPAMEDLALLTTLIENNPKAGKPYLKHLEHAYCDLQEDACANDTEYLIKDLKFNDGIIDKEIFYEQEVVPSFDFYSLKELYDRIEKLITPVRLPYYNPNE